MATIEKVLLSGSTNGRNVKVVATATAGTLAHTATAVSGVIDEVWLWATNSDTVSRKLTIEFGGVTSPDDTIEIVIPPESGPFLVVPGLPLAGGLVVRAFAATANVVLVSGYVNRYTP